MARLAPEYPAKSGACIRIADAVSGGPILAPDPVKKFEEARRQEIGWVSFRIGFFFIRRCPLEPRNLAEAFQVVINSADVKRPGNGRLCLSSA